tara:strand:- start:31762 stop:32367 length:606 start_codon:yes stop_codon:yes gene_type:complete
MNTQSTFLKKSLTVILVSVASMAIDSQAIGSFGSNFPMGKESGGGMVGKSCPDTRVSYTPKTNLQFIDMFQPHHMMAVEMAKEVVARGSNSELRSLAQKIILAQTEELRVLSAARKQLTGNSNSPMMKDPHMDKDMMTLRSLSGAALDIAFIDTMIPHHASGIPSAHQSLPHLTREDLKEMAMDIINTQAREIGEMQRMRE